MWEQQVQPTKCLEVAGDVCSLQLNQQREVLQRECGEEREGSQATWSSVSHRLGGPEQGVHGHGAARGEGPQVTLELGLAQVGGPREKPRAR